MRFARSLLLAVMDDVVARRARDGVAWLEASGRAAGDVGALGVAFAGCVPSYRTLGARADR
jgi:hypothetical protein